MARFNLNKGERFSLKKSAGLEKIAVELTWKSGADLDASAFLLGEDGVIVDDADFVFYNSANRTEPFDRQKFGNKKKWMAATAPISFDLSVKGAIDDLGEGDEESEDAGETMYVDLDKVRPEVTEIVFCVTIYRDADDNVTFKDVRDPQIVISNDADGEELCAFNLSQEFSSETAVVAGALKLNAEGEWEFEAIGKGYNGGLQTLVDLYA